MAVTTAPQSTQVPGWLNTMRSITGVKEAPGSADNPQILAMADSIAQRYPEMTSYCKQYNHDSIAWCGLAVAYCCAMNGVRPPFGPTDTDKFLWARSFEDDVGFTRLDSPRVGCIVVSTREGGGHVNLFESSNASTYNGRGGNQSDEVNVSSFPKSSVLAYLWPKEGGPVPPAERRLISEGDTGSDVAALQRSLGLPDDGEFGPITTNAVESFQAACNLAVDGEVGPDTWAAVDELNLRVANGSSGLTSTLIEEIIDIASASPAMTYQWKDRGKAPAGYIPGMALCYGVAVKEFLAENPAAILMAQADRNNADTDALTWLRAEFTAKGMPNDKGGLDVLRHLFVLLIGLGMRESSGRHCEGRDITASNTSADTAEAGLFQTSWNIHTASAEISQLIKTFWANPNGFLPTFAQGVEPTSANWDGYGTGLGARYQWLAKYSPAFAAAVTAIGLRLRRQHWGPINRKEVELLTSVDAMLSDVQAQVVSEVAPEPEPVPPGQVAEVKLEISATGPVRVIINGQVVIE